MISYFEKQLAEINHSIHSLDTEAFEKLLRETVEALEKGHKIIVSGLGKNVPICEKFVGSMISMVGRLFSSHQFGGAWRYGNCEGWRFGNYPYQKRGDIGIYLPG